MQRHLYLIELSRVVDGIADQVVEDDAQVFRHMVGVQLFHVAAELVTDVALTCQWNVGLVELIDVGRQVAVNDVHLLAVLLYR